MKGVKTMNMVQKAKAWLKSESSQVSNENGMFIVAVILLVVGITALLFPPIKTAFTDMMDKFLTASGTVDSSTSDPIGSTDGSWEY